MRTKNNVRKKQSAHGGQLDVRAFRRDQTADREEREGNRCPMLWERVWSKGRLTHNAGIGGGASIATAWRVPQHPQRQFKHPGSPDNLQLGWRETVETPRIIGNNVSWNQRPKNAKLSPAHRSHRRCTAPAVIRCHLRNPPAPCCTHATSNVISNDCLYGMHDNIAR